MKTYRKISRWVGVLFLIGTGAGILSRLVTQPLLAGSDYLQSIAVHETQWTIGSLLILVMGLPLAMVPVALFPLLRKQNEILAIGAIVFRGALEAIAYVLMVLCALILLTLARQAGTNSQALGDLVRAVSDWLELLLAVVFSIGSIMINLLLYRSRLAPRWLSGWGLAGSFLYFAAPWVCMLSPLSLSLSFDNFTGFLIAPLALEEMVFAVWLLVKGFTPTTAPISFQAE